MPPAIKNLPPNNSGHATDSYYAWGVCGFLLLAVGLIYGQTLNHILLAFDDSSFVSGNPHVTPGLTRDGVHWAFTSGPFGEWYPLSMLSHMLDCQLYGLSPWGHHLTNLLLHAATSIGLFLVLWRMTDELWPSAFVGTLLAVHPQHVESVAWLSERKDVLSGFFFVLTLGAYLGYVRHGRSLARYALVMILFALGLMAKPMIVTLPPLLLLLDFWPLGRIGSAADLPGWTASVDRPGLFRVVVEKPPLLALVAVDSMITLSTHCNGGVTFDWSVRIGNAAVACVAYVVQVFYPVELVAFYPIPTGGQPLWKLAGAIAILPLVSAAVVIWRRRCPYAFVGWFWYLGMLSPVLGLVKVGWPAMADRYMYLPGIGISIAFTWGITRGVTRLYAGSPAGRWLLGAGGVLATGVLIACATWLTSFWRDDETLWTRALAYTTNNGIAEFGLADGLARLGRIDEAVPHYRRAVELANDYHPFRELGLLLARQGKIEEATGLFRRAIELDPTAVDVHCSLGLALAEQKQFAESEESFRRALEIKPDDFKAHRGLGHVLRLAGLMDEARAEFELAVDLDPRDSTARNELGVVLLQLGMIDQAIAEFEATLALDPKHLPSEINLALALTAMGRTDEATDHFRHVLQLDPDNPVARKNLDRLLREETGQPTP